MLRYLKNMHIALEMAPSRYDAAREELLRPANRAAALSPLRAAAVVVSAYRRPRVGVIQPVVASALPHLSQMTSPFAVGPPS